MSDEDAFQAALDADPADHTARLVFADWLDECDDPRAAGYREMGRRGVVPYYAGSRGGDHTRSDTWHYTGESSAADLARTFPADGLGIVAAALPDRWCLAMENMYDSAAWNARCGWFGYAATRLGVEDMAALAFAALPAPDRDAIAGRGTTAAPDPLEKIE